ncbi:MAG: Pycsar system effector family protein [Bacteroidota bacterium]
MKKSIPSIESYSVLEKSETKEKKGLASKTINIIRTTQRNNIELTAIADNKANVLLTLNALILTAIIPYVLRNSDLILGTYYYIPIMIATVTCFLTIYQATLVLTPYDFDKKRIGANPDSKPSPFFFGNFYKMRSVEYYDYLEEGLKNPDLVKAHLAQDLFYIGRRLGIKMARIRTAFTIFLIGLSLTLISTAIVLIFTPGF